MYSRWESNPHSRKNWILNPARLPIPPLEHYNRTANLKNILLLWDLFGKTHQIILFLFFTTTQTQLNVRKSINSQAFWMLSKHGIS